MRTDFTRDQESTETPGARQTGNGKESAEMSAVSDAVGKLVADAKRAAGGLAESAASAGGEAKDYVGQLAGKAASEFKDAVETHKSASADAIASLARSARDAADGFEKQSPQVAQMVRSAAGRVERVSSDLRDHSINDLVKSVSDFAHRQPKVFFGCGIIAGLVLSRLLRGSAEA